MRYASLFDPVERIPHGRSAIEASAGTGKTFTIAAQVTRLVADEGIPIDRVLVVTFTRAATAELEDQIRRRLVRVVRALESGNPGRDPDRYMSAIFDGDVAKRALRRERLIRALSGYERAQIHTIHGFALQVLVQLGFYAPLTSDLDPVEVSADMIRSAVADALIDRFSDDADHLVNSRLMAAIAETVVTRPDATIIPDCEIGGEAGMRAELACRLRGDLRRRLQMSGLIGYDQIMVEACSALNSPDTGEAARAILQSRFDVALVDEAQDTDPVQWRLLQSIFNNDRRLVVIGDPKQSIYSFRGADVEAYLNAVEGASNRRTLPCNWRSDGPLIQAYNALFDGVTFGDDRIGYTEAQVASKNREARVRGTGAPIMIRRFGDEFPLRRQPGNSSLFYVGEAREAVANDVAAEIVALLHSETTITNEGRNDPVGPGDIAVLCRTRRQVELVRGALERRGVPSVATKSESVFISAAAQQWRRFLHGIERPNIVTRVRLAATTDFVGLSLGELNSLDDEAVVELQFQMRRWRDLLRDAGISALLSDVDQFNGLAARLLSRVDGERTLTDLTHLAEVMNSASRSWQAGSLLGWLEDQMVEAAANTKTNSGELTVRQRRLETDADAVQVQTIHGAKGLEYPIVFCPYLWDKITINRNAPKVPVFHNPDYVSSVSEGNIAQSRFVDVGGPSSPDFDRHLELSRVEEQAEEVRLLYVAVTRARHRLVLWWVNQVKNADDTALNQILTRYGESGIQEVLDRSDGTICQVVVNEAPATNRYKSTTLSAPHLAIARLDRPLDYEWSRVSYSSLSLEYPANIMADKEETSLQVNGPGAALISVEPESEIPLADFPAGARFGTLVHEILEHTEFDIPDLERSLTESAVTAMRRLAWDLPLDRLVGGLAAAVRTPLTAESSGTRLRDIANVSCRKEMRFDLPIRAFANPTSLKEIGAIIRDHLEVDDPLRDYAEGIADSSSKPLRGFLTGAVDLFAVLPEPDGP